MLTYVIFHFHSYCFGGRVHGIYLSNLRFDPDDEVVDNDNCDKDYIHGDVDENHQYPPVP